MSKDELELIRRTLRVSTLDDDLRECANALLAEVDRLRDALVHADAFLRRLHEQGLGGPRPAVGVWALINWPDLTATLTAVGASRG